MLEFVSTMDEYHAMKPQKIKGTVCTQIVEPKNFRASGLDRTGKEDLRNSR